MFKEKYINTGKLKIHAVEKSKTGYPLLMLHDITSNCAFFDGLISLLSPNWQVFAPDFRGHGKSDRDVFYRLKDHVKDTIAFIDAEITEPVVLLGHSMGGMVAIMVAAKIPKKIRALIIEDAPLPFYKEKKEWEKVNVLNQILKELCQMRGVFGHSESVLMDCYSQLFPNAPQHVIKQYAEMTHQVDPHVAISFVEEFEAFIEGYFYEKLYQKITCPVLLLQGDRSKGAIMLKKDIEKTMNMVKNITLKKFNKTGHLMHFENLDLIFETINNFLETI